MAALSPITIITMHLGADGRGTQWEKHRHPKMAKIVIGAKEKKDTAYSVTNFQGH